MKTSEQVIEAVRSGKESACIDGRDFSRLADFVPVDQWSVFGFEKPTEDFTQAEAVAVKYGLPNPIGDDSGTESEYSSD